MDKMTSLRDLGHRLIASPKPGAVTDYKQARLLEATTPNISNAWTHVVPALAKYAKCEGKRSLLGRDKGEMAYRKLEEKLFLVVLGLYGDGLLSQGASTEECLSALLRSLVSFKEVYPNWTDAYSAGYKVFVEGRENINPVLDRHQRAVKAKLGLTQSPPLIAEGGIRISDEDEESGQVLQTHTADSFQIAHEYVNFRKKMNRKAGGFLGMFRKIDYGAINSGAVELKRKLTLLHDTVSSAVEVNTGHPLARPLREYTEALCAAVHNTKQKTDMMLQLSQRPGSVRWDHFKDICRSEDEALARCQISGDRLTTLFRSM